MINVAERKYRKICVLKGGDSPEREVSLVSATNYMRALDELGYVYGDFDFSGNAEQLISYIRRESPDCVLNALHGGSGENGNIQALMNLLKVPYTHSGVMASSVAMDKRASREAFAKNGLRVPTGFTTFWNEFRECPAMEYPFVIKPVDGGSSVHVRIIRDQKALSSIDWQYKNGEILVEEYIPGLELTVGVLDDRPLEVTNLIVPSGFLDYDSKYSVGRSLHEIPAKISPKVRDEVLETAMKAHKIIGCRGVSRSDFRYNDKTEELYILELNTQPGMTPFSFVPEQAEFVGIPFAQLVQWIIEKACYDT
ncbi:MAG: D-alanine--D-alanine ligase [Holosporaceae bacterium]|jgi:D-alanine-D-alanine ligase|nr:D-alanine--D-alanine ligase [Holosporaceae bacterium]